MPTRLKERTSSRGASAMRARRKLQVIAILLILVGILLGIAILSYTRADEINADTRLIDLLGIFTNDPQIRAKAEATHNWLGLVGAVVSSFLINGTLGYFSLVVSFLFLIWGWGLLRERSLRRSLSLSIYLFVIAYLSSTVIGMIRVITAYQWLSLEWAGAIGEFSALVFSRLLGAVGGSIVLGTALFIVFFLAYDLDIRHTAERVRYAYDRVLDRIFAARSRRRGAEAGRKAESNVEVIKRPEEGEEHREQIKPSFSHLAGAQLSEALERLVEGEEETEAITPEPAPSPGRGTQLRVLRRQVVSSEDTSGKMPPVMSEVMEEEIDYSPPTIDLLDPSTQSEAVNDEELKENAELLRAKLANFDVEIESVSVTPGPVVTLYELVPASDVKISRITSLADDLALALKARGIRIIAPMPGKGTIGVEIPNAHPAVVRFRSVVNSTKFREFQAPLPLAMGKTISGEVYVDDLARMPHLLIAGATGSGKSVGINTILMSLVYRLHPADVKFVIIDPKKIELSQYALLRNHFLALSPDVDEEIITTPQNAVSALKSVELEMEHRYNRLAAAGVRSIIDYNERVRSGRLHDTEEIKHCRLPYLIVVIDELADLMMTAAKEVEEPIARLAQLARAVGIHLVVATQRPSVDVLTGVIKANFSARIAYQVASKTDSRTILDMNGAEQLLGSGDMLYLPSGSPKPIRIQNAYLSPEEVERITEYIGHQKGFSQPYQLPSIIERKRNGFSSGGRSGRDELFEEAARLVVRHQQGSVSLIQRRLKVGYSRAARLIDELEAHGIVGAFDGSKAREVLIESEEELEQLLRELEKEWK
ncbi:MAG: DNA translocase FtsK 4TM domain-containing protein [Bacteroidota bacterium]